MPRVEVDLGERSYTIVIGSGLLNEQGTLDNYLGDEGIMIVTNETIAPLYLDTLSDLIGKRLVNQLILPDGEQYKNLDTLNLIFDALLENTHSRGTTLVALGGGVIGDITGFAAACYQRGVNFIQIPTTLLAQVDSSVGGKTAVNHRLGKNMIGAFHQPQAVLIDIETLTSLPDRQYKAGLAEVIKYGLIIDQNFFVWLEQNFLALLGREPKALLYAIEKSCRLKAGVVKEDERETGVRAILNFGHTFAHAIETFQDYSGWLHGEAVAAGMAMAADMSARMGWLPTADIQRLKQLLALADLPVAPPAEISRQQFFDLMAVDKKVRRGLIRLVLLKSIGHAIVTDKYDPAKLNDTLSLQ